MSPHPKSRHQLHTKGASVYCCLCHVMSCDVSIKTLPPQYRGPQLSFDGFDEI